MSTYTDSFKTNNIFVRTFLSTLDHDDLIWHRDATDRILQILQSTKWFLIIEGCYPTELVTGSKYYIPANTYHRLKKGYGDLIIQITTV